MKRIVLGAAAALLLAGCGAAPMRSAPPVADFRLAVVPGFDRVRVWADQPPASFQPGVESTRILDQVFARAEATGAAPRMSILAISGGAADGAYGAGVLNGWTERGDRPAFDVVTGISTGALIAPFAFLGPDYDARLAMFFTTTETSDIAAPAFFSALFRGGLGLTDSEPLRRRIGEALTDAMIDEIAAAHAQGRRLYVGTTNLDARRSVIWDMGAIATRGSPDAYDLFRDVLTASASIPGAFPPRFFDVEIGGERYREMHVDGGVTNSVFIAPRWFSEPRFDKRLITGGVEVYVLQNNKIVPNYGPTSDSLISIAGDSVSELIRNQSSGDLQRIYSISERRGFEFYLATVPNDFNETAEEAFDPVYMQALFAVGLARGRDRSAWIDRPPNLPALIGDTAAPQ